MNNNFHKVNEFSHDTINLLNDLGHEVLECAINNTIPIINNISNSNIPRSSSNIIYPNYEIKSYDDSLYIYIELLGCSKEDCKINIKDNILKLSAKTSNDENNNWNFIKIKNYNRTINLPLGLNQTKIDASMKNGILKIIIEKESMNFDSNIEIN